MNKVVGISMCKNELDIAEPILRHMATQVDCLIVSDNGSTDGTRDLLSDLDKELPLRVLDDPEIGYYQSRKMTDLAKVARNQGAEWVVPFDFDEIWYSPFGIIKDILGEMGPQWLVATADLYNHVTSSEDNLKELNPVKRIGWRRSYKGDLPKVACRYRDDLVIGQGNHSAKYNGGPTFQNGFLVIRHYPYRSRDQFISKARTGAAAYAATDLPEEAGAHWRGYGRILNSEGGEEKLAGVYKEWFYLENPRQVEDVIYDPAPVY